jgi:hypothetical protein
MQIAAMFQRSHEECKHQSKYLQLSELSRSMINDFADSEVMAKVELGSVVFRPLANGCFHRPEHAETISAGF